MTDTYTTGGALVVAGRMGEHTDDSSVIAVREARTHPAHIPLTDLEQLESLGSSRKFYRHTPTGHEYVVDGTSQRFGGNEQLRLEDFNVRMTTADRTIVFLVPCTGSELLDHRRAIHDRAVAEADRKIAARLQQAADSATPVTFAQARGTGYDYTVAEAGALVLAHGGTIARNGDHIIVNIATVHANRGVQLAAAATLYAAEATVLAAMGRGGKLGTLPDRHVTPNGALI